MGSVNAVIERVFPSVNDLAAVAGDGKHAREQNLAAKWLRKLFPNNFVYTGLTLSAPGGLTARVAAGEIWLEGYYVGIGQTDIALAASSTNHLYIKLVRDGAGNVANPGGVQIEANTTGTPPADSHKLGTQVTDGSGITGGTDTRELYPIFQSMLRKPCVGSPELKTATGSASGVNDAQLDITMNDYAFTPALWNSEVGLGTQVLSAYPGADPSNTVGRLSIAGTGSGSPFVHGARWRYITASDNPVIWIAKEVVTGTIKAVWCSDDPTPGDIPGVRVAGCESLRLTAEDLAALDLPEEALAAADARIASEQLDPAHRLYRALEHQSGAMAPAEWLMRHAAMETTEASAVLVRGVKGEKA